MNAWKRELYNDFLMHYGVKGMKWRVRRGRKVEPVRATFRRGDQMYQINPGRLHGTYRTRETTDYAIDSAKTSIKKALQRGSSKTRSYVNAYDAKRRASSFITKVKRFLSKVFDSWARALSK